jgi:2-methylcitrate dehydratase PrpD
MSVAAPTLAPELARRARAMHDAPLPVPVAAAARLHVLDAIGVGLAGGSASTTPLSGELGRLPAGRATVLGRRERLSPVYAALANGTLIHSLEFDDTHVPSVVHGSAIILPAALAVAEQHGASGRDLLSAFVAGWETLILLGLASPGGFQEAGFQTAAVTGPFGAAIAAGLLAGLDQPRLANALGICGSQASGTFAFLSDGSTVKAMHAGWAAHSGLLAAEMAIAGVSGPTTVFEDRFGFFACYTSDPRAAARFADLLPRLGATWALPEAAFKCYPVCHYIQPFLEAAERLRDDGLRASDVVGVRCRVPDGEAPVICEPWERKLRPHSDHDARWSLPICVAKALLSSALGSWDMTGIASEPEILALAARINWERWRDSGYPARFPAHLTVTTTDGRELTAEVADVRGSLTRPLTEDEVHAKFIANAAPTVGEAAATRIAVTVDGLSTLADVRELTAALGAPSR